MAQSADLITLFRAGEDVFAVWHVDISLWPLGQDAAAVADVAISTVDPDATPAAVSDKVCELCTKVRSSKTAGSRGMRWTRTPAGCPTAVGPGLWLEPTAVVR
jgi:hypothetical protein